MQAENTHSRQKRQRLWYQRDGFLWGLVVALIAAAWGLLPPAGTSLGIGGWLGMGLYMLLAAVPMIVTTMDKRRPQLAGTAAALGFLGLLGLVFYRYSGAQWDMLGMMFFNRELIVETWPILLGGLENTLLINFSPTLVPRKAFFLFLLFVIDCYMKYKLYVEPARSDEQV